MGNTNIKELIMKRLLLTFTITLLIFPAFADEYSEKLKIANEYSALQNEGKGMDLDTMIEKMWMPIVESAEAKGKIITDKQKDELRTVYYDTFSEPLTQIMENAGLIMAENLTLVEITALRDFYKTEVGRSILRKMPGIQEKEKAYNAEIVKEKMPDVFPVLRRVFQ